MEKLVMRTEYNHGEFGGSANVYVTEANEDVGVYGTTFTIEHEKWSTDEVEDGYGFESFEVSTDEMRDDETIQEYLNDFLCTELEWELIQ